MAIGGRSENPRPPAACGFPAELANSSSQPSPQATRARLESQRHSEPATCFRTGGVAGRAFKMRNRERLRRVKAPGQGLKARTRLKICREDQLQSISPSDFFSIGA